MNQSSRVQRIYNRPQTANTAKKKIIETIDFKTHKKITKTYQRT